MSEQEWLVVAQHASAKERGEFGPFSIKSEAQRLVSELAKTGRLLSAKVVPVKE